MTAMTNPVARRLTPDSIVRSLQRGWALFLQTRQLSVSYAMAFALIGVLILVAIERASFAPIIVPLTGGLLFFGAILLTGYFALADRAALGERGSVADIVAAYRRISLPLLTVAALSTALFIVWVVDVATLYGFIVGRLPRVFLRYLPSPDDGSSFMVSSCLLAALLPVAIFAISAFSVPLLYYRRARLLQAVRLSVAAVFDNPAVSVLWALIVAFGIVASIVVFPLILLTFPVLALASHSLYCELFPGESGTNRPES